MQNILVAIDFSEFINPIISQGKSIAKAFRAKLWLIHVTPPEPDFVGYGTGPQTERDYIAHKFRQEHRQLQQWAEKLRQENINAVALLLQGQTVETIIEQAEKLAVDLIIVGSHGHRGLYNVLMGSISEGVLRRSSCPVMIIPAKAKIET